MEELEKLKQVISEQTSLISKLRLAILKLEHDAK